LRENDETESSRNVDSAKTPESGKQTRKGGQEPGAADPIAEKAPAGQAENKRAARLATRALTIGRGWCQGLSEGIPLMRQFNNSKL
jgi:hypothetical protein